MVATGNVETCANASLLIDVDRGVGCVVARPRQACGAADGRTDKDDSNARDCRECRVGHRSPLPAPKLIAVPPRGELRTKRLADPNQLEPVGDSRQPDVVGRNAKARSPKEPFTLFDRFPALLERREIPPLAATAHDPQPTTRGVECQAAPNGEMLDRFVLAELGMAKDAGSEQG
jgi:hypothetical protein